MNAVRLLVALVLLSLARPATAEGIAASYIAGRLMLLPGVPLTSAHKCKYNYADGEGWNDKDFESAHGFFRWRQMYESPVYKIMCPGIPTRYFQAPANRSEPGESAVRDLYIGDIVIGTPSAIAGTLKLPLGASSEDYDKAVIAIPELGLYTRVGISQEFLLTGVPMGTWTLQIHSKGKIYTWVVKNVKNGALSPDHNIVINVAPNLPTFPVQGL